MLPAAMGNRKGLTPAEAKFADWAEDQDWRLSWSGWPDFLCETDDNLVLVEVKNGLDTLRSNQRRTLSILKKHGIDVRVWRPDEGFIRIEDTRQKREGITGRPKVPDRCDQPVSTTLTPEEATVVGTVVRVSGKKRSAWGRHAVVKAMEKVLAGDLSIPRLPYKPRNGPRRSVHWSTSLNSLERETLSRVLDTLSVKTAPWVRAVILQAARRSRKR